MSLSDQSLVMDISPWPKGRGFSGSDAWWKHTLNQEERKRLDDLVGAALLDPDICERLVNKRDDSLLRAFGLSEETQGWLRGIKASSLVEFANAIVTRTQPEAMRSA